MTTPQGTTWDVDRIVKVIDGDSLHVLRSTITKLGDDWYRIHDVAADGTRRPVALRLAWVDTPERGKPGWAEAREDLFRWVDEISTDALTAVCYESAGWDRILADLTDANGNSASQWLMTDRGWPPYEAT